MHARFAEPGSDFLAFLNLWDYLREQQQSCPPRLPPAVPPEYLHYLRVREWQDVYGQLRQAAGGPPASTGRAARTADAAPTGSRPIWPTGCTCPLLAGLLSHIGMQDTDSRAARQAAAAAEFAGARGARFAIFPDSALARKPPRWVVAAELVETSRLWARVTARIEPEWAEPLAAHLLRRSYSEPRWDARRGAVVATEKVTLYGLPIVAARTVSYGRIDPAAARDLFIRTRWWRATGGPTTRSSPATSGCSPTPRIPDARPGGAAWSPTTPPCSASTTSGSRLR